jgi:hypothetical protein
MSQESEEGGAARAGSSWMMALGVFLGILINRSGLLDAAWGAIRRRLGRSPATVGGPDLAPSPGDHPSGSYPATNRTSGELRPADVPRPPALPRSVGRGPAA